MSRIAVACVVGILSVSPAAGGSLTVSNLGDDVNGDVKSPAALLASPGPDGISLREAVVAANAALGPHEITFAPELAGGVIYVVAGALHISRPGITIIGFNRPDGSPAITIDGSRRVESVPFVRFTAVVYVTASQTRIARLRLAGARDTFLEVVAGESWGPGTAPGWARAPNEISDIRIEENVFDNEGYPIAPYLTAMRVWMDPRSLDVGAKISRVSIARNRVVGYTQSNDTGFIVSPSGTGSVIEDVTIERNVMRVTFALELSYIRGTACSIRNVRIAHNELLDNSVSMLIGNLGSRNQSNLGNVIEHTVIDSNVIRGPQGSLEIKNFSVDADVTIRDCVIRDTTFSNNLLATGAGIVLVAGEKGTSGNRIENVVLNNNTLVTSPLAGLFVQSNRDGGVGNVVSGVVVTNTLFHGPVKDVTGPADEIEGEVQPSRVFRSLTNLPRFAGNGNVTGDPRFVNRAAGDFHLAPDSPARDAGDPATASAVDLDCATRVGLPDIGAYEYGSPLRPQLTILDGGPGTGDVAVTPQGIPCGARSSSFPAGSVVTLIPRVTTRFQRWSGDADCVDGIVTMDRDRTCVAYFALPSRRRLAGR